METVKQDTFLCIRLLQFITHPILLFRFKYVQTYEQIIYAIDKRNDMGAL